MKNFKIFEEMSMDHRPLFFFFWFSYGEQEVECVYGLSGELL